MRHAILWVVCALVTALAGAQSAPITGVVVESIDKPAKGPWVFHLVNYSHKYVTAINIGTTYPDGPMHGEQGEEFSEPDRPFAPGATVKVSVGPPNAGTTVLLDVVVYDDDTAESTNDRALHRIEDSRKRGLITAQMIVNIIQKAKTPAEAAAELDKEADAVPVLQGGVLRPYAPPMRAVAEQLRKGVDPQEILSRHQQALAQPHDKLKKIN
jgi:hypothetical protein